MIMKTKTYKINGMKCDHCRANVENGLAELPGVQRVSVDLGQGIATVEGDVDDQAIINQVESLGFECEP